jgi:hypothetical protein
MALGVSLCRDFEGWLAQGTRKIMRDENSSAPTKQAFGSIVALNAVKRRTPPVLIDVQYYQNISNSRVFGWAFRPKPG